MLYGFKTGISVGSAPHRINQKKLDQLRDGPGQEQNDQDREGYIKRGREKVLA
jgi:hypothetical protein